MSNTSFESYDPELEVAEVSASEESTTHRSQSVPLSKLANPDIKKVYSAESFANYLRDLNLEDHPPTSVFYGRRQNRAALFASPLSPLFNSSMTTSPELLNFFSVDLEVGTAVEPEAETTVELENLPQASK